MNSLFDLAGRTALITGSVRGIGFSLAEGLAAAGASVILNGRRQDAVDVATRQPPHGAPQRVEALHEVVVPLQLVDRVQRPVGLQKVAGDQVALAILQDKVGHPAGRMGADVLGVHVRPRPGD